MNVLVVFNIDANSWFDAIWHVRWKSSKAEAFNCKTLTLNSVKFDGLYWPFSFSYHISLYLLRNEFNEVQENLVTEACKKKKKSIVRKKNEGDLFSDILYHWKEVKGCLFPATRGFHVALAGSDFDCEFRCRIIMRKRTKNVRRFLFLPETG